MSEDHSYFYNFLDEIEKVGSSIQKENLLAEMLHAFPESEKFLRMTFNDIVYGVAEKTFYNAFSLKPRGRHLITVCLGTACHVKGAGNIMSALETHLGIKMGQTTEDMMFTLEGVRCIGCCGLAPVLKVGEDVHGLMTVKKVPRLIDMYRNSEVYDKVEC